MVLPRVHYNVICCRVLLHYLNIIVIIVMLSLLQVTHSKLEIIDLQGKCYTICFSILYRIYIFYDKP